MDKEAIIGKLREITGSENVNTDPEILRECSYDRYNKVAKYHGFGPKHQPCAFVSAKNAQEISEILQLADTSAFVVVAHAGGSATEGGLETAAENTIVLDCSKMNEVLKVDTTNMFVTAQCGVNLEELESALRAKGYTTGHSPQSKPLALLGGLTATRSLGQYSTLYGGIEDMIVGLEAVFPNGEICRIKNIPRRAAGPDIRHIAIGNEGAICFITEVSLKIYKYFPENNRYLGYALDDMKMGFEILRKVMAEGYRPSMARLYDVADGERHFSHFAEGKCVLIFMAEGNKHIAAAIEAGIREIVSKYKGLEPVDGKLIETWYKGLNWWPEKLEEEKKELMATQVVNHTNEVSGNWDVIYDIYAAGVERVGREIPDLTLLGGHSSHSWHTGTNMYFVYSYKYQCPPEEEMDTYHKKVVKIIVEETLKRGGSMVHHHGIGKHRAPWVEDEYGSSFYMLKTLIKAFDKNNTMNPGTIIPADKMN